MLLADRQSNVCDNEAGENLDRVLFLLASPALHVSTTSSIYIVLRTFYNIFAFLAYSPYNFTRSGCCRCNAVIIIIIIILTRTIWTSRAILEGASYKAKMITTRAPFSFSDSPFSFNATYTMWSLSWVPLPTQPSRTKCSRSSTCSSF